MRVVYCLTTDGSDRYAASTLVSAASVRRLHREARITLLTDESSARVLESRGHPLLTVVDDVRPVYVPVGPAIFQNRFVKTQQRKIVAGDFLYLDADTVVVRPLDEIFQIQAPFAAASNHNRPIGANPTERDEIDPFRKNGWALPTGQYVNGGVLFFRDCAATHVLGELWHRKWLNAQTSGDHFDQPALNSALVDSRIDYAIFEHRFNAQVQVRPFTARGAHVWHNYASTPPRLALRTGLDDLIVTILKDGALNLPELERFCRQPYPWTTRSIIDMVIVHSMMCRYDFLPWTSFERMWLAGYRRLALTSVRSNLWRTLRDTVARACTMSQPTR